MIRLLIIFLIFSSPAFAQENGSLKIKIEGIKKPVGAIAAAIFDRDDNFLKKDFRNVHQKISKGDVYIVFENLPPGTYAVSIFHDENSNKKLDTNFIGLPVESYGFGNNARGMFGPPSFENSSIQIIPSKTAEITIEVR